MEKGRKGILKFSFSSKTDATVFKGMKFLKSIAGKGGFKLAYNFQLLY